MMMKDGIFMWESGNRRITKCNSHPDLYTVTINPNSRKWEYYPINATEKHMLEMFPPRK